MYYNTIHKKEWSITGPWQVMLKQGDGSFACVAESDTRFTLGEVVIHLLDWNIPRFNFTDHTWPVWCKCYSYQTKEELLRILGLQEEKGSSLEFLRRGYKVCQHLSPDETNHIILFYVSDELTVCILVMQNATWWEEDVDLENSSAWRNWMNC